MKQTMANCFRISGNVVEDTAFCCKLTGIQCSKFDPAPACNVCRVPDFIMAFGTEEQRKIVKDMWVEQKP